MFVGSNARRLVGIVTVVSAMVAGASPVLAGPAASGGTTVDDGFTVTERTVTIDQQRPLALSLARTGAGPTAGGGTETATATGSAVIVHPEQPELLVFPDVAAGTTLAVRSHNRGIWSDWTELSTSPDEAPDGLPGEEGDGAPATGIGPVWIGHDADRTEVAVIDGSVSQLAVQELDVTADAARRDALTTSDATAAPGPGQASATTSATTVKPVIRPRSDWATPSMTYQCTSGPEYSNDLRAAVVHHTATTTDYAAADVPEILRGFWRFHTQTRGWCDIAYNFLVDRFGTIWEGRLGGVDRPVIGGHAKGFNTSTVGVALIGEFGSAPAYSNMIHATEQLIGWKLWLHGVDPLGWTELQNRASDPPMKFAHGALVRVPTVIGHRDLGLTSCPGTNVHNTLPAMRRDLGTPDRVGSPPYVFDRWKPSPTGIALASIDARGGIRVAGAAAQTNVTVTGTPVAIDGGNGDGYVLTTDGRLTPFSGAPAQTPVVVGTPVDLIVRRDGTSGWILTADGRLTGFGGASSMQSGSTAGQAVAAQLDDSGRGYVLLASGTLLSVGGAPARSIIASGSSALDMVTRQDGTSGWVLTADGAARGFGGAPTFDRASGSSAPRALILAGDESGVSVLDADGRLWPLGGAPTVFPLASHVGVPNAIDAGRLGRPGLPESDLGRVVIAEHQFFLQSTPTGADFDRWFFRTEHNGRVDAALGMAQSDQYAGLIIDDLYRRVLNREPDAGGRANWLNAIRNGMRIEQVGVEFYGSAEYFQRAGSIDHYVELLYQELLHRTPDPGGFETWTSALREGRLTPKQVAAGFYGSIESRRDRVTRLYRQVLLRDPDPGGLATWAEQLITHDDLVLAAELAGSREFYLRVLQGTR